MKKIVIIYEFLINGSSLVVFGINVLADINLWEKYKESIKKLKKSYIYFEVQCSIKCAVTFRM